MHLLLIAVLAQALHFNYPNQKPPVGTVGQLYHFRVYFSGGKAPYVCSVKSGALPPGLHLSSHGNEVKPYCLIYGTPTAPGVYAGIRIKQAE